MATKGKDSGLVVEATDNYMNPRRGKMADSRRKLASFDASKARATRTTTRGETSGAPETPSKSLAEQRQDKFAAERASNTLQGFEQIPFKIYRVVRRTNKAGGYTKQDFAINNYRIKDGDFLLDVSNEDSYVRPVINLDAVSGAAYTRVLQPLESPWGFPEQITVTGPPPDFTDATLEELQNAMTRRDLKPSDSYKEMHEALEEWEDYTYMHVPLFKLTRKYTAIEAGAEVDFLKGEIVRLVANDRTSCDVIDFERQAGRIKIDDIERASTSFPQSFDHIPFGYRIEIAKAGTILPKKLIKTSTPGAAAKRMLDEVKAQIIAGTGGSKRPQEPDSDHETVEKSPKKKPASGKPPIFKGLRK